MPYTKAWRRTDALAQQIQDFQKELAQMILPAPVIRIVVFVTSLFFLFAGTVKMTGWPEPVFAFQMSTYFAHYGIERPLVFLIGCCEVFGAVAIWFQRNFRISGAGGFVLLVISAGALRFHLTYDTLQDGSLAAVMLVMASILFLNPFNKLKASMRERSESLSN